LLKHARQQTLLEKPTNSAKTPETTCNPSLKVSTLLHASNNAVERNNPMLVRGAAQCYSWFSSPLGFSKSKLFEYDWMAFLTFQMTPPSIILVAYFSFHNA
jgi:hypothetical protein